MSKTEKPWGYELLLECNDNYACKKLFMRKGHKCSLQYHNKKIETFYVISGRLLFSYGPIGGSLVKVELLPGKYLTINPLSVHRMEALEDSEYLEASTPHLDDVVRIEDEYGRA